MHGQRHAFIALVLNDLKEYFYLYFKKHLKAFFHRKAQYWHNYFHIVYSRCFGLSENN